VLRFALDVLRFALDVLRFALDVLRFTLDVLRFALDVLRFAKKLQQSGSRAKGSTPALLRFGAQAKWSSVALLP
jgi:hypothetical protein